MNKALVGKYLPYEQLQQQQQQQQSQKTKEENQMPKIKYNETSKRVHFVMFRGQSLSFSPALMTLFGVAARQNPSKLKDEETYSWSSAEVCDIMRGLNYMMLYCDLLEHVPVGDTKAPLLRIVDTTGSHGDIIHRTFEEPRYIPLQKKHFDSVEVDIRDDLGNAVAFENGKLVVTLHFRQTRSPYYLG